MSMSPPPPPNPLFPSPSPHLACDILSHDTNYYGPIYYTSYGPIKYGPMQNSTKFCWLHLRFLQNFQRKRRLQTLLAVGSSCCPS